MTVDKQRRIARLIGLPVTDNDKPEVIFNHLFGMINRQNIEFGEYKGQNPIELFNRISAMSEKVLAIKSLVKEAIQLRVLHKRQNIIYDGENAIAQ